MIKIKRKEVSQVNAFGKTISKIYAGGKLVWEAILSCFGSGFWINDRSWINNNAWNNGKI